MYFKRVTTALLACLWTLPLFALHHGQPASLWDHLTEVNVQWEHQSLDPSGFQEMIHFESDMVRIQTHLFLVETILRSRDMSRYSPSQKANRLRHLNVLRTYHEAGNFPINDRHDLRTPYFIDKNGTACAVGYLLIADGQEAFARRIQDEMNNAYLLDMPYSELPKWAEENGFSLAELAWIQPGYNPWECPDLEELGHGALKPNGPVNFIFEDTLNNQLILAGGFTSIGGVAANHIGTYNSYSATPLGSGINGRVYAASRFNGKLYLGGTFNNGAENLAVWDGTSWVYESIYTGIIRTMQEFNGELVIGGDLTHSGGALVQHILKGDLGSWVTMHLGFDGPVNALTVHNGQLYVGGEFLNSGTTPLNYVAVWDSASWQPVHSGLDTTVNTLVSANGDLYAAGVIEQLGANSSRHRKFGIARMNSSNWEIVLDTNTTYGSFTHSEIFELRMHGSAIMARGLFEVNHPLQYVTNYATSFDPQSKQLNMYSFFDLLVDAFGSIGNEFVVGGSFTFAAPYNINYAASKGQPTSIHDPLPGARLHVFPNPAVDAFHVRLEDAETTQLTSIELFDLLGKKLTVDWEGQQGNFTLKRGEIPAGTYFVRLKAENEVLGTKKVVFQ